MAEKDTSVEKIQYRKLELTALTRGIAGRPESKDKLIVVVLPDTGERYLSTWLFQELYPLPDNTL